MPDDLQDVRFRQARAADVDQIAEAHRDSIASLGSAYYPASIVVEWERAVAPELYLAAMKRGEVFFVATATRQGQPLVLGFASDYVVDGTTHGTSAYVRGDSSRRGIGSRLLLMAESFGVSRGATAVHIEASLGAVAFYQAHGFVETGRGEVTLQSGALLPCAFMRKELTSVVP